MGELKDSPPSNHRTGFEIAIVGMAGRFPGAKSVDALWRNLRSGVESISFFSDEELAAAGVDPSLLGNPKYVKARATLDDIEWFDASFFGYAPYEAELMDPQQRAFLECAWEALENAGYDPQTYPESIGVFAGASLNTYLLFNLRRDNMADSPDALHTVIGNGSDFLATRVAYKLNLRGPACGVQTACSTSLVAVHYACQSLLGGECDMALAGGVSINARQKAGYVYHEEAIYSPDGHCRAFDSEARGTVSGNGAAVVVLKRLESALADGDCIHAVIKGSAVNNDGSNKIGFTAPGVQGQAQVVSAAQAMAEVHPETIGYIETHGTGTRLGDPIEIAALTQAFRSRTDKTQFCAIGSIKTNLGHLDAAAGVTGLIKAALALKHRELPPSLHYRRPNPEIDFQSSPFYVNDRLRTWPPPHGRPRRAGVSSFGLGGTNAHAVLEEPPAPEPSGPSRELQLVMLSARTDTALEQSAGNLARHLRADQDAGLPDIAYTLHAGRRAFTHRRVVLCDSRRQAVEALEGRAPDRVLAGLASEEPPPVVFMFSGQGSQYVNMGAGLYHAESVFRDAVDRCAERLRSDLGLDLRQVLYPTEGNEQEQAAALEQTALAQPALFVVEYALARLWMSWGVQPDALIGHSIGEYVAACLAGVYRLEDALSLVAARGRLAGSMPEGAMLAVSVAEDRIGRYLRDGLSVAAVNEAGSCVLSGPAEAVSNLENRLSFREIPCRRLHTSHAFHSPMMDPILEPFARQVKAAERQAPRIPLVSNVTGTWITDDQARDPDYWVRHLRQTVRFAQGVGELMKVPRVFLEVGPGTALSTLVARHPDRTAGHLALASTRHPRDGQPDVEFILRSFARLWIAGAKTDARGFFAGQRRRRVPLPTYPFERGRYWIDRPARESSAAAGKAGAADRFYLPVWRRSSRLGPNDRCGASLPKRLLVFVDETGLGRRWSRALGEKGCEAITVQPGQGFQRLAEGAYAIDPKRPDDYAALIDALDAGRGCPSLLVHMGNVTRPASAPGEVCPGETLLERGYYSLLNLAKALAERKTEPCKLLVISTGLHDVTGQEALEPGKALALGPVGVIPQELPHVACRSIDVELPASDAALDAVMRELTAEIGRDWPDQVVAHRGPWRWVRDFVPVTYEDKNPAGPEGRLRKGGVYLITGGLGGIGLLLAEYLAGAVPNVKLALLGRSGLPADDGPASAAKREAVDRLRQSGAEVLVQAADVSDADQMRQAVDRIRRRFGVIHGVVHAAGIPGGGLIQAGAGDRSSAEFAPKVMGTCVLAEVFQDAALDFMLFCSSQSSLLGGVGRVAYAAANAFQDAYARYEHLQGPGRTISVNWDRWENVGMAAAGGDDRASTDPMARGMSSAEGVEAFARLVAGATGPQVIVSMREFHKVVASRKGRTLDERQTAMPPRAKGHARPSMDRPYAAPSNPLEREIAEIWADVLGLQKVGIHDRFNELGGDSLVGLRVLARIRQSMAVELTVRSLFENPTVAQFAEYLENVQWTAGGPATRRERRQAKKKVEKGRI